MRETFELKIFERQDHYNKRKWYELTELESGEVLFEDELYTKAFDYAVKLMHKHPGQYKLLKN